MNDYIYLPAVSCVKDAKSGTFLVQVIQNGTAIAIRSELARNIATDLLIWADRVDKLNEESCDETL